MNLSKDWIDLGTAPTEEPCAQVGSDTYYQEVRAECRRFIALLKRVFPNIPEGVTYSIKAERNHDAGTYYTVAINYEVGNEVHWEYVSKVESETPELWE